MCSAIARICFVFCFFTGATRCSLSRRRIVHFSWYEFVVNRWPSDSQLTLPGRVETVCSSKVVPQRFALCAFVSCLVRYDAFEVTCVWLQGQVSPRVAVQRQTILSTIVSTSCQTLLWGNKRSQSLQFHIVGACRRYLLQSCPAEEAYVVFNRHCQFTSSYCAVCRRCSRLIFKSVTTKHDCDNALAQRHAALSTIHGIAVPFGLRAGYLCHSPVSPLDTVHQQGSCFVVTFRTHASVRCGDFPLWRNFLHNSRRPVLKVKCFSMENALRCTRC